MISLLELFLLKEDDLERERTKIKVQSHLASLQHHDNEYRKAENTGDKKAMRYHEEKILYHAGEAQKHSDKLNKDNPLQKIK